MSGSRASRAKCRGWMAIGAPSRPREGNDVVAAAVDGADACQPPSARTRLGIESDDVGDLQSDQRLDQVVQVGDEESGAGLAGGHRLTVGVDVLDQGGVLEQVDAVVVLALGAKQSLAGAVDVEGGYAECFDQSLGHLRGAQLGE